MILLVFEGKDDSYIFKTLEHLFFKKNERRICCFNQNIYELFRLMQESDFTEDIVSVIRDRRKFPEGNPLADVKDVADISEVYLFFDYDFQNKNITLEEANRQVEEMLLDKRKGELRLDHVSAEQKSKIKDNWQLLKQQNVSKANYICTGNNEMPLKYEYFKQ